MPILKIAVPCPLPQLLDYFPPPNVDPAWLQPGVRVKVHFAQRKQLSVGILVEVAEQSTLHPSKLKTALELLDTQPLISAELIALCQWVSRYYHHPLGEVFAVALPTLLNKGKPAYSSHLTVWQLTANGQDIAAHNQRLTAQQRSVLQLLQQYPQGLSSTALSSQFKNPLATLKSLQKKGWLQTLQHTVQPSYIAPPNYEPLTLNNAQQQAISDILEHLAHFKVSLLDGVTGSGKTEVYLQIIQAVLEQGKQALLLVPEINLTPQMLQRFQSRFSVAVELFHSYLTPTEQLQVWLSMQSGATSLLIGTRSAIWLPLLRPGVVIVDEEHDGSYKQQDGLRYSARDLAVMRARQLNIPVVLGSATPALESVLNAAQQRYQHLCLPERAGAALRPRFQIVDMRQQAQRSTLSKPLLSAIQQRLDQQQQVLIFINRRGYAPLLMCFKCGWVANCTHCDARVTYHQAANQLRCHHCGHVQAVPMVCPSCQHPKLSLVGQGTERLEEQLQGHFPSARLVRMDSDTVRSRTTLQTVLEKIHSGEVDILLGTQMLAKGHHFPQVTLVGIINVDGGLFSVDFRGTERMGQLLLQVAGRAGRATAPGDVIMQTYHPDHPLLKPLLKQDYAAFSRLLLAERRVAQFPPFAYLALLRCEATQREESQAFLQAAKAALQTLNCGTVQVLGPAPAPMERRADWYRTQLLLQAGERRALHTVLVAWLPLVAKLPSVHRVRWSVDIDPYELF